MAAAVKGWLDDSRNGPIWTVGGYAAAWHRWEFFEGEWPSVLRKHDVPYFHMREMAKPNGVYAKWHPPKEHKAEVAAFMADLAAVIKDSRIVGILSIVRLNDLERFNRERKLRLEPYPLGAYGCMIAACQANPGLTTELIFDHLEEVSSKLATARKYAESDDHWRDELGSVVVTPLTKKLTWRDIPALQAADFIAWEFRKHHERTAGGLDLVQEVLDSDVAWERQQEWIFDHFGSHEQATRKSAQALINGTEFYPLIWDYRGLNEIHEARCGLWP